MESAWMKLANWKEVSTGYTAVATPAEGATVVPFRRRAAGQVGRCRHGVYEGNRGEAPRAAHGSSAGAAPFSPQMLVGCSRSMSGIMLCGVVGRVLGSALSCAAQMAAASPVILSIWCCASGCRRWHSDQMQLAIAWPECVLRSTWRATGSVGARGSDTAAAWYGAWAALNGATECATWRDK